ncbi:TRAP transporter small permease subunit [Photobacterium sp. GJ3]|uniref:TRAP transporter small permease subunit n=1 Tax=Photobacterium sp. GJ3 TaxID=2829502 RepID=UPI001B8D06C4|nr:TRAP transporter small permease subunit [Photobacterium sp. GJ3]QUJ67162.1 TRAP transporter small permease subunit [Photobacterium sp. GJ3]
MSFLLGYCQLITTINRWVAGAVSVLVFIMVAIISFEVVSRYFFHAPTTWAMELSSLIFGPYFMLAGPYFLHTSSHINVDIIYSKLSPRLAGIFDCLIYFIIAVISVIFIYQSFPVALNAFSSNESSFTTWNPIIWPVKALIPISFLLLFLQALAESITAMQRSRKQENCV